ncbi:MAG: choice-of-anchor D domain-containing protein [Acidobacteriia bacterium]|nr:choice-of-anchor D domain-containing protein [Terriglobia bacterium]
MSHQLTSSEFASNRDPQVGIAAGLLDRAKRRADIGAGLQECDARRTSTGTARAKASVYRCALMLAVLAGLFSWSHPAQAQIRVTTEHNDNARTGADTQETVLTHADVNVSQFGKLYSATVDGYIYAQPLYLYHVNISGVFHNVVYVATEHDSVYAFDADTGTQLWHDSFINPPSITTVSPADASAPFDLIPEIGITGTPAIDPVAGTLYVVVKTKQSGSFFQRLHALDVATGSEKSGSPVTITASVSGTGDGSVSGTVAFDPLHEHNRPGLLLENGHLIIAWASHEDTSPFHGWVMSYNPTTLAQEAVYNTTPNGGLGGIWMSGSGLAADSSNIYFSSGNGTYNGTTDFGDSAMKIGQPASGSFPVVDWFTPFDQSNLDTNDLDLGSGGVILIPDQPGGSPHQHLLLTGSKNGAIYLLDRDNMGHFHAGNDSQVVQSIQGAFPTLFGAPAWWNNTAYFGGSGEVNQPGDFMKAYHFDSVTGLLSSTPSMETSTIFQFPGPTPTVSSNGTNDGIVWALENAQFGNPGPAVLHAYDATNLATELYSSSQNLARDNPGLAVKFTVPTVANGKVFVGTQNQLSAFGLLNPPTLVSIAVTPASPSVPKGATQQFVATGTYSDSSTQVISGFATWTSTNTSAATVAAGGLATAVATGSSTIQATLNAISGSTTMTVTPPALVSIAVTPANPSIFSTGTQQFTATGTYTDNTTQNITGSVTWTSSSTAAATINSTGLASGVAAGSTTIKAASGAINGTTNLTVLPGPALLSIAVTPASPSIPAGTTQQFTATGTYSDSSTANITNSVTWTSGTLTTATINSTGLATTVAVGTSLIQATMASISGSTTLAVTPSTSGPVGHWAFDQSSGTLAPDSSGHGYDATLFNGTAWIAGKISGAISANNTNQYASTPTINLSSTPAVTVAAWVNRTYSAGGANGDTLLELSGNYNDNEGAFGFFPDEATDCGTPAMEIGVHGNGGYNVKCYAQPTSGVWHHIAVVFVLNNPVATEVNLYVDGVLQTALSQTHTSVSTSAFGNFPLYMFTRAGTSSFAGGQMDDLQLFTRALSASEISTLASTVPGDFIVSGSPATQTVMQGNSTTYTATITPTGGFTGPVTYSLANLPFGVSGTFNPPTVTAPTTSTLTLSTLDIATIGTSNFTIVGTSGSEVHTAAAQVVITAGPNFTMSSAPASQSVVQGAGTTYTATVAISGGFNKTITFTAGGLPNGATASFNPTTVTGAGTSTMTVTTASSTPTGTYPLTIAGTSGDIVHTATSNLVVTSSPNFSLTATPALRSVIQGSGTTFTSTVGALGGFTGVVSFSVSGLPTGATGTFSPTTVTGSGSSTLTVTTLTTTPTGTYPLTVTGTSGSLVHTANTTLVVLPPVPLGSVDNAHVTVSACLTPAQSCTAFQQGTFPAGEPIMVMASWGGSTTTATISDGVNTYTPIAGPLNAAIGPNRGEVWLVNPSVGPITSTTITLSAPATGSEILIFVIPLQGIATTNPVDANVTHTNAGNGTAMSTGNSGLASTTANEMVWGMFMEDAFSTPYTPAAGFTNFSGQEAVSLLEYKNVNSTGIQSATGTNGVAINNWIGLIFALKTTGVGVTPTLSSIAVTPTLPSIAGGATQQFTATGIFSDNSTQNLTSTATWSSTTPATATISASGLATGVAVGTTSIQATSGGITGSTTLTVTPAPAPDFTLTATPASRSINQGSGTTYNVTVSGINAFAGTAVLSVSGLPANATGTFNPPSVTGNGASTLTINTTGSTPTGQFTLTITGTSGALTHSTTNTLTVLNPSGPTLLTIAVTPANSTIPKAATQQFVATGTYSDSSTADVTGSVVWSTSSPAIATMNSTGLATAVTLGNTTITATAGAVVGSTGLTVSTTVSGITGYWKFDEGTGTNAADSSGNGLNATLFNGVTWITGVFNGAISANNVNQYVSTPLINLTGSHAVSVSAWVNRTYTSGGASGTTLYEFSSSVNGNTGTFALFPDEAADCGTPAMEIALRGDAGFNIKCFAQPTSGVWHNLAVVYDVTQNAANEVTLYIDGVLQTALSQTQNKDNTAAFGNFPLYLFSRAGTTSFSGGQMDDFQLYGRALTAADVQNLYNERSTIQVGVGVAPTSLTFGSQAVSSTSAAQTVTATSVGLNSLTIANVAVSGDFAVSSNTCNSTPMPTAATCTINVTFTPTTAGARSGSLTISSNDPNTPTIVPLSGTGSTSPAALISPTTLNFGKQGMGTTSATLPVNLASVGVNPLNLSDIQVTGDFNFPSSTCTAEPMTTGVGCTMNVTFTPTASGTRTGSLIIISDDPSSPTIVTLSGTTVTTQSASYSTTSLVFGNQGVGTNSAPITVSLSSVGTSAINLIDIQATGDFTFPFSTCTAEPMTNGAGCSMSITFSPTAAGTRTGTLTITSDDPSSPAVISLSGTGVTTAAASVSPTSLTFGKQGVGTTSSIQSVTLTSVGANPLLISNITSSGDFGFPSSTCTANPMGAGVSCIINVTFSPTGAGTRTGQLTIVTNDPSSPLIVQLTGTGVTTASVSATPAFPVFGRQGVGVTSSPVTVTVSSVGANPLVISNIIVGGNFAIQTNTCTSAPMAASATCTITATFKPTVAGATGGSIVVFSNDPASPLIIPMTGTGVTTSAAVVTPVSPTFATQPVNTTSSPLVLTLTSVGATPLNISDIIVGGDFKFVSSTCTALPMAPSTSCTLNVTFTPTGTGTRTGSMVISTDDPLTPLIVPLAGTGN